jgi:hypothetical protein
MRGCYPFLAVVVIVICLVCTSAVSWAQSPTRNDRQAAIQPAVSELGPAASSAIGSSLIRPAGTGPTISVLASFNITTGGNGDSFPLNFTVPAGVSHVLYAWAIGGGLASYSPPTLPAGMTFETFRGFIGLAFGALAPGNYSTVLYYAGWTNVASIVVYGLSQDSGYTYAFVSQNASPVTLPAGADEYLGIMNTGGTYPVNDSSLTRLDAEAAALRGGETALIGRQTSGIFSATTQAAGLGIAAVGVYAQGVYPSLSPSSFPLFDYVIIGAAAVIAGTVGAVLALRRPSGGNPRVGGSSTPGQGFPGPFQFGSGRPCPYCGTINALDYSFCMRCAKPLPPMR